MEPLIPRLPGESSKWYSRFLIFVSLAPTRRSVRFVYDLERRQMASKGVTTSVPSSWRLAVDRFDWRGRADAFDRRQQEEEVQAFGDLRKREARKRFDLLRRTRRTLETVLKQLSNGSRLGQWSVSDLLRGVAILAQADREEQKPGLKLTLELTPEEYTRRVRQEFSGVIGMVGAGAAVMTQDDPE